LSRAIPIFDENGGIRKWFGAANDITGKKQMEAEFRQKEKLTAVGQIASTIAHEINNPLESVTNLLYLARISTVEPQVVEYLESADIELRRVAAITSQTLRFHKQLSNATEATAQGLLSATLNTYQGRIQNSDIQIERRDRATGTLLCFEGEIQQVLNNLLGNAIDVLRQHGGKIIVRSAEVFDWKTCRPSVRLTIADSGTGIPKHMLGDIFQPFFTTKGIGGTGLGLWISKEIMDRHAGRLQVRSSTMPGRSGTVFTVLLPRQLAVRKNVG
jgi:signal transduction histidine kinase